MFLAILLVKFCFGQLPTQPPQNVHCLLSQLYPPMSFPREQAGWPHPQWVPRPMIPLDHSGDEFQQAYWTYWPQASSSVKMGPKVAKYIIFIYYIYIYNLHISEYWLYWVSMSVILYPPCHSRSRTDLRNLRFHQHRYGQMDLKPQTGTKWSWNLGVC